MRRASILVALTCICTIAAAAAFAGGDKCTGKDKATMAKAEGCSASCCSHAEFPTIKMMVGDKCVQCPVEADKLAKETHSKIIYAVAGEKFECKDKATVALAAASEDYVNKFTRIACVADGKVIYCDEQGACNQKDKTVKTGVTGEGSGCCKAGAAKTSAKAEGCCKAGEKASLAKAEGTCHGDKAEKGEKTTLASSKDDGCTHGAKTGEQTKLASDKSEGCTKSGEKASMAKAGGCCKSGEKGEKTTLASAKGEGCCKSGEKATLAKADAEACCKNAKNVKFLVVGRTFDKYEDAVKARDAAVAAVKKVSMKYVVEGKEVDCESQVCPMAKAAGKVEYVINKEKTKCEYQARYMIAKARYEAASSTVSTKTMAKI